MQWEISQRKSGFIRKCKNKSWVDLWRKNFELKIKEKTYETK